MTRSNLFIAALLSEERASEIPEQDDIFGFLIGSWELKAILWDRSGETEEVEGELYATWILEGRAIQDLFIFPRRTERRPGGSVKQDRYATTIRTYDRVSGNWQINFINPVTPETNACLIARRAGQGIAMEGALADGTPIRWKYSDIRVNSFRYAAERRWGDGTWNTYLELFGTR